MIRLLTIWLLFGLIAVALVCVPRMLHADTPTYVYCERGLCVMSEEAFDLLLELSKKAGKTCI